MCGIIGYVGNKKAIEILHNGLKKLEYRGYDSAGISFFEDAKLQTIKKAGTVDNLFKYVDKKTNAVVGIGHTRWATHGKATDENSHPHTSFYGRVSVVHNGIIENYKELVETELVGIKLKSETDTEVVSNLIEKYYILFGDELRAIAQTMKLIKGSYALAIMFTAKQSRVYFAKNFSPLLVGVGFDEHFISSDILGFVKYTNSFIEIDDKTLGFIENNKVSIFDIDLKLINKKIDHIDGDIKDGGKDGYAHYMLKEINEISKTIKNTANAYLGEDSPLEKIDKNFFKNINRIKLIACGTSYHACLIGENIFTQSGYDATAHIASEFIYSNPVINEQTLCIFISQSGETADTLSAIQIAKQKGAKTLGITNVSTSTITKVCDQILPIVCGAEIAVASTKAYNGQLCALYILDSFLKGPKETEKTIDNLKQLANKIDIKTIEEQIKPIVKHVLSAKNIFMVGRHNDYVTSLESALKLKEITYLECQGYASGELKHGTISLVENKTLVFAFVTEKYLESKTMNVIKQTQSRDAKICVVTPFENILTDDGIDFKIALPDFDEKYLPLLAVLPMQLLAYYVSVTLGNNPDKPRNLAKSVTVE